MTNLACGSKAATVPTTGPAMPAKSAKSPVFKLKKAEDDDSEESFFFEQKAVHFTSEDVFCNGFLSDDKKNVSTIQLKFKPQTYCCP